MSSSIHHPPPTIESIRNGQVHFLLPQVNPQDAHRHFVAQAERAARATAAQRVLVFEVFVVVVVHLLDVGEAFDEAILEFNESALFYLSSW